MDRRTFLKSTAAAAALAPVATRRAAAQENTLNVNTWGGSWTAAEDAAFFKPFTEKTRTSNGRPSSRRRTATIRRRIRLRAWRAR